MKGNDRELGMGRAISRRDFLYGTSAMAGVGILSASGLDAQIATNAAEGGARATASTYPPLRHGMRGFHPGSFEPVHAMAWTGYSPPKAEATGEVYDLVVVGGGLSGLAAAYYYRKKAGPSAKVLILDNLDGFGGHAQRNEFEHNGKRLVAYGGSTEIVAPMEWSAEAKSILDDLGIAKDNPADRTDYEIYRGRGMEGAVFFPKETYGRDKLVKGNLRRPTPQFLSEAPLSPRLRSDLDKLMNGKTDYLAGHSTEEKITHLRSISYRDYLLNVVKVSPETIPFVRGVWCLGTDACTAWFAFFRNRPGFEGLGLKRPDMSPESEEGKKHNYTLPGGNADVARLLVRALIPDSLPSGSFIEVADAHTDYTILDRPSNPTRIRQSSIVYNVKHDGPAPSFLDPDERDVVISYLNNGKAQSVKAANVVMACMNNVVPFLCPEIPEVQKVALRTATRAANQMTKVLFRNWRAFEEAKLTSAIAPNSFYGSVGLASPRYLGRMEPSESPSEPIIVSFNSGGNSGILSNPYMVQALCGEATPKPGTPADEQFQAVRHGLLQTPFEVFERNVREQSARILAGTSFDPARDIVAITVNRWPHGFATGLNELFDEPLEPGTFPPTVVARQKFGRIAIANSDAGGVSTMQTAFDQAWRAIDDLESRAYGFYEQI